MWPSRAGTDMTAVLTALPVVRYLHLVACIPQAGPLGPPSVCLGDQIVPQDLSPGLAPRLEQTRRQKVYNCSAASTSYTAGRPSSLPPPPRLPPGESGGRDFVTGFPPRSWW